MGFNVSFTNTSGGGFTYFWNFGDPSSGANDTSTLISPMKADKLRRNVDLSRKAVIILQWHAIASGRGTIKPYLEDYLESHAQRILTKNPSLKKMLIKLKRK